VKKKIQGVKRLDGFADHHHSSKLGVFRHLSFVVHDLSNIYRAITFDDTKALWHIDKKNSKCNGRKWKPLLLEQEILGCNVGADSSTRKNGR